MPNMTEESKSIDVVSHGRGGAGNIATGDITYVDGEIVREGIAITPAAAAPTTQTNSDARIDSPTIHASAIHTFEIVPEDAIRFDQGPAEIHTERRRGGGGNNVRNVRGMRNWQMLKNAMANGDKVVTQRPMGLADKLKYKLFRCKRKDYYGPDPLRGGIGGLG